MDWFKMNLPLGASKRSFAIDGVSQSVNDTSEKLHTDGYVDDGTSSLDDISFTDQFIVTEHDHTDVVGLQVQSHTLINKTEN